MKKCVLCRAQIELMVPMTVCSGGLGTISEVKPEVEIEPGPSTSDINIQGNVMNNGNRDTSNDIQKLQQQLQDIKEQVPKVTYLKFFILQFKYHFRLCVPCVWIV